MKDFKEKLINLFNKISSWFSIDGLLHFLVCYTLMLTFQPIVGMLWALVVTIIPALIKEAWDYFIQKDNTSYQVKRDLIFDWFGIAAALAVITLWNVI